MLRKKRKMICALSGLSNGNILNSHFSPHSMEKLAGMHGFSIHKMKPMVFDSYYVSMLSKKYKSGGNLWKAFTTGWNSNRTGSKDVRLCSSVMYILKVS